MMTPWPAKAASPCISTGSTLSPFGVAAPLLPRPHRAFDHRIHDLEVRGIEGERHMHVARRGLQVGGEALVVLHVARAAQLLQVVLSLELGEQILGRLAEQVHQHVEPAAMRHADDGLLDAVLAALPAPAHRAAG